MRKLITYIAVFFVTSLSVDAAELALRSHEATYAMKHVRHYDRENWSPVERADGVLRYRFTQSCEAWMVEHSSAMHMDYENAQQAQMTWNYTSWEAKDGSKLRFRSRTKRNGVLTDKYTGEARREGENTVVIYADPNGRREIIALDTYFPTSHQKKALELAEQNESIFSAVYFDGSGEDADFDVSTFMSRYKGKPLAEVDGIKLPKTDVWNVQLAFFLPQSQESKPEMEVSARYRKDGISTMLRHDFGDFVMEGQLVELRLLPEPKCD